MLPDKLVSSDGLTDSRSSFLRSLLRVEPVAAGGGEGGALTVIVGLGRLAGERVIGRTGESVIEWVIVSV